MGKRLIERRMKRQAKKGGIKLKTLQKWLNKSMKLERPEPPIVKPVETLTASKGGQVRTKKQAGGLYDPRQNLTTAQKKFYSSKQREAGATPSNPAWEGKDRNVRKKRPGGFATGGRVAKSSGGSVSSRLSKAGPVAKPN
jgi:hypothetical protein